MGLLDDAIREHLELKRRRGADPGEVAREQQEALDPVLAAGSSAPDGDDHRLSEDFSGDRGEAGELDIALAEASPEGAGHDPHARAQSTEAERSPAAQETVELDMQTVLDEDAETFSRASDERPQVFEEASDAAGELPGQEHLSFE